MKSSGIRYEIRYVEPGAKWEPDSMGRTRRMLIELPDGKSALDWMAAGNNWRGNFADYRICAVHLSPDALSRRADNEAAQARLEAKAATA